MVPTYGKVRRQAVRVDGDTVQLRREPLDGPAATALIAQLQDDLAVRYGGPDANPVEPEQFAPPCGEFLVLYVKSEPAACGGFRRFSNEAAELKRMYVRALHRRLGLARRLLTALEEEARGRGYRRLLLETGLAQPEAIALYAGSGYKPVANYGYYRDEPDARSYEKTLT